MKHRLLLDCTLRDGGYLNEWNFGYSTIHYILNRLQAANIDIIELGFLNQSAKASKDSTLMPDTNALNAIYGKIKKTKAMLVAMIDYGTCDAENICDCKDTMIDGIRIIFKQHKIEGAMVLARQLKEKGYQVFLQMVSVTTYNDHALLDFADTVSKIMPFAVSMVDTYGLLHKEGLLHIFHVLDHNLPKEIILGYHSHNNFQLGYANSIEVLSQSTSRTLLVDGTVHGMGKSAGNAPLELLAMHLNDVYHADYEIDQLLEIIDVCILRLMEEYKWGYSLPFFLAASNDCHPNYVQYLLGKMTLSIQSVQKIINSIPIERKLNFDKEYIHNTYQNYMSQNIDDKEASAQLRSALQGKILLLLAPGSSIQTHAEEISAFIQQESPIVISLNFLPKQFIPDYIFITSGRRYLLMQDRMEFAPETIKIIATSNVTSLEKPFDYILNFERLMDKAEEIMDNSGVLCLRFLSDKKTKEVVLAGLDGFNNKNDYADSYMSYSADRDRLHRVNEAINTRIAMFRKTMNLRFLTKSLYDQEE